MGILKKTDASESIIQCLFKGCRIEKHKCFIEIYLGGSGFTYYKTDLTKAAPFGKIRFWGNLEHVGSEIEGLDLFCAYLKCKSNIVRSTIKANGSSVLSGSMDEVKFDSPFIKCGITPVFSNCNMKTNLLCAETHIINNSSKIKAEELRTKTLRCIDVLKQVRDGKKLIKCSIINSECQPQRIIIEDQNYNYIVFELRKTNSVFKSSDGYWFNSVKSNLRDTPEWAF